MIVCSQIDVIIHVEGKPSTGDWMSTDPLTGKEDTDHLVDLSQHSGEYREVSQAFRQTISYYKIKKIQRIQNPKLWSQYAARKKTMDKENPHGMQNERKLFHGCTEGAIQSINHSGFNASNAGRKGVCMHVYSICVVLCVSVYAHDIVHVCAKLWHFNYITKPCTD